MKCIIKHRCRETSQPDTNYMDSMLSAIMNWHARILSIWTKMTNCRWHIPYAFSNHLKNNWQVLYEGTSLERGSQGRGAKTDEAKTENSRPKDKWRNPMQQRGLSRRMILIQDHHVKHDTRSTIEDELDLEVIAILKDVEKSSANFIDDVWKSVVSHIGAVKLVSYLGHIFLLSLNFQTLMRQLVFTESIFPVSMNREHLRRGASMLCMFAELLPEIRPCAISLPPLPAVQLVQAPAKPNALTPTTSNPDDDASAMNLDNPPDNSSNRPLPPALMVAQAMHMPTLAPQVSMPKMLVPNFSMSDATEHSRAAICLLLGLKGLAEVVQACSGTPMDGDKSTPKAIVSIGIMSSQHRCPHPIPAPGLLHTGMGNRVSISFIAYPIAEASQWFAVIWVVVNILILIMSLRGSGWRGILEIDNDDDDDDDDTAAAVPASGVTNRFPPVPFLP